MEEVILRFSFLGENIFKLLDNKGITKCRKVGKTWCAFLDNNSTLWKERIQIYVQSQVEFHKDWKSVTIQASVENLRKLALATGRFYRDVPPNTFYKIIASMNPLRNDGVSALPPNGIRTQFYPQFSPLFIAAEAGDVEFYKFIAVRTGSMNPVNNDGLSPLHLAALHGNLEVVKFIGENSENKNPANKDGLTPLHNAAYQGSLDVFKYIADFVENKNPSLNNGWTPLLLVMGI